MNRRILSGIVGLLLTSVTFAQSIGNLYDKSIGDNKKIAYPYVGESDVVWAKNVYRIIDLREKINLPLYYPTVKYDSVTKQFASEMADGRNSFSAIILNEIKKGNVVVKDGDEMSVPTTYADIAIKMGKDSTRTSVEDANGKPRDTLIISTENPGNIKQLLLWEQWYFDKKLSTMEVRILGICPIYLGYDPATSRIIKRRLFWVKFEDVRQALATNEAFNTFNDAQRVSFEDILIQRRFDSYIVAESNVYDDRFISQYKLGQTQIFEADKIKNEIFNQEQDLWEY